VTVVALAGCGSGDNGDSGLSFGPTGSPTSATMTASNTSGGTTAEVTTGTPPTSSSTGAGSGDSGGSTAVDPTTSGPGSSSGTTGEACPPGSEGCACLNDACDGDLVCEAGVCAVSVPGCGNGKLDPLEECDDGNAIDTDDCLSTCVSAKCGDGKVQDGVEACDDGNMVDGDGCTAMCALESCGDGKVEGMEVCDDGNKIDTDACLSTCLAASCGDGQVQAGVETCDDGNQVETDACLNTCKPASCGDGKVQAGVEECDDANKVDTDACISTCKKAVCGDKLVQAGVEECDDGNMVGGDGCTAACLNECGNDCWGNAGCKTNAGRCIRFTCTPGSASQTACESCFGWKPVSFDQWMNQGYCSDVTLKYRSLHGNETRCGGAPLCCTTPGACGGGDNAWHFHDGANNRYVGPCLGCANDMNCAYWQGTDNGSYTRITACERK
jgi:cysteine-rich repeat protein